jgi:hypothetical protein
MTNVANTTNFNSNFQNLNYKYVGTDKEYYHVNDKFNQVHMLNKGLDSGYKLVDNQGILDSSNNVKNIDINQNNPAMASRITELLIKVKA